jgi:hypothetical protein
MIIRILYNIPPEVLSMKFKRFIAIFLIAVLAGLYLATFISAIFTSAATPGLFKASLLATFVIPVYMYVYLMIYKHQKKRAEENRDMINKAIKEGSEADSDEETESDH